MYTPSHFKLTDKEAALVFVEANNFGQLVSLNKGKLCTSHLPFLFSDDRTTMLTHVAKVNPQHQELSGEEVMLNFLGPHGYISPSWYHKKGVPTWNYQAVEIRGTASTFTDNHRLKRLVDGLTTKHEAGLAQPWQPNYSESMFQGIVGIEIIIESIQAKAKLSQNRDPDEVLNVIEQVRKLGNAELADLMTIANTPIKK